MSDKIIGLFILYVVICSSCISVSQLGSGGGGVGGLLNTVTGLVSGGSGNKGFDKGFVRGMTNPVGAVNDLSNLAQNKQPELSEASPEMECKIKCGEAAQCTQGKKDAAAGTIPVDRQQIWDWCSGNITPSMSTTSKEKFGKACCT